MIDLKEATKMAIIPGYGTIKLIETAFGNLNDSKTIKQLEEQAIRQKLEQAIWEAKAKTLQEIAIAKRIETATTVEIEEYYDLSGEASAGISTNGQNIQVGMSAAGRKVSKRIYRFTGWSKESTTASDLTEIDNLDKQLEAINNLSKK